MDTHPHSQQTTERSQTTQRSQTAHGQAPRSRASQPVRPAARQQGRPVAQHGAEHVPTVIVTTAALSGSEDRRLRERRYLLTQLCRVVCFVLAVTLPVALPVRLFFILGAFVLPWMGVVAANAGPAKEKARPTNVVDRGSVDETWDEPLRITYDPSTTVDQD